MKAARRPERIADRIAQKLRAAIVGGRLRPGDALPSERELASQYDVNRSSIREAMGRLETWGLVKIRHGGATRVSDFLMSAGLDLLPHLIELGGKVDPAILEDLHGIRGMLLGWCAEVAARKADASDVERLEALVAQLSDPKARPAVLQVLDYDFYQELVRISQAPVWDRDQQRQLKAGAIGLRVYACATPDGYAVMPGGLTRVATGPDARVLSMQRGGGSKDTWVLSSGPVSSFSLIRRAVGPQDLVRASTNLSSRVAENLFWFGRYTERCDNTARLLRTALAQLIEDSTDREGREWGTIVDLCRQNGIPGMVVAGKNLPSKDQAEAALMRAVVDPDGGGLAANFRQLFRVAFQLRERLSLDNWRALNRMVQSLGRWEKQLPTLAEALTELDLATTALMTMAGFALDGMTRDQGWRFLSMGRRVERMQFLCTSLRQGLDLPPGAELDWLLELADSIVTYRSRYMARPDWLPVLDLLVRDESNPRSIAFQLLGLYDFLSRLADTYGDCGAAALIPLIDAMNHLDVANDLRPDSAILRVLMGDLRLASFTISERIGLRFFSHAGESNRQTFAT